jgi:hypothetical protein
MERLILTAVLDSIHSVFTFAQIAAVIDFRRWQEPINLELALANLLF